MIFRYATDEYESSTMPDPPAPEIPDPPVIPPVGRPAEPFAIDPFATPSSPGRVPSSAEQMEHPRLAVPDTDTPEGWDPSRRTEKGRSGCAIAAIVVGIIFLMALAGLFFLGRTVVDEIGDSIELVEGSTEGAEADQTTDTQQPGAALPPTDIEWAEVTAGDCINLLDPVEDGETTFVSTLEKVDCHTAHDAEVFAVFDLEMVDWPGSDLVYLEGDTGCFDRFEGYVGIDYMESYYFYEVFTPTADSWAAGDRTVACVIVDPGGILDGPVRGSGA